MASLNGLNGDRGKKLTEINRAAFSQQYQGECPEQPRLIHLAAVFITFVQYRGILLVHFMALSATEELAIARAGKKRLYRLCKVS